MTQIPDIQAPEINQSSLKWWQVFNPAIYLISILPAISVFILAGENPVWQQGLVFSTLAVVLLQHAINLFNDASDWKLGADTEKMDSWVRLHHGNTSPVTRHALISFIIGGLIGLSVLIVGHKLWIVFIALPLIGLGYLYNAGETPLSYNWTGEWVTGLCYGPGVFGCLWFVAGLAFNLTAILGMFAFAALAVSLLLSHQPPQIETDRQAGKKSFCVRYGVQKTCQVSIALFTAALLLIGTGLSINYSIPYLQYALFSLILMFSLYLVKAGPNPKKILLLSSTILLLSVIALPWLTPARAAPGSAAHLSWSISNEAPSI
ncbi:MAG: prenyltransferase [Gammaproteobacteria bacterium]|nr:prenyltransferase [Gammaproteobacteria bacterium]